MAGVAGPTGPAFVERPPAGMTSCRRDRGLPAPPGRPSLSVGVVVAERPAAVGGLPAPPGRPSLSVSPPHRTGERRHGVAGPTGPAFVERPQRAVGTYRACPGLPAPPGRPSLSDLQGRLGVQRGRVGGLPAPPGRPSLSAPRRLRAERRDDGLPAPPGRPSLSGASTCSPTTPTRSQGCRPHRAGLR